jgi:hypothetical protein
MVNVFGRKRLGAIDDHPKGEGVFWGTSRLLARAFLMLLDAKAEALAYLRRRAEADSLRE